MSKPQTWYTPDGCNKDEDDLVMVKAHFIENTGRAFFAIPKENNELIKEDEDNYYFLAK